MNPAETPLVNSYTQALFSAALERNVLDQVAGEAAEVHALLVGEADFRSFMRAPNVPKREKERILMKLLEGRCHPLITAMVRLLIRRGRLDIGLAIFRNMQYFHDKHRGIQQATVVTAIELGEDEKARMLQRLEAFTGFKLNLSWRVVPSVIGGVRFLCGDMLIDRTISDQLFRLRAAMMKAKVY